jgi:hypothetical protein
MEKKYRALRIISGVYYLFGISVLVFGTVAAAITAFSPSFSYRISGSVVSSGLNIWAGIGIEIGVLIGGVGLLAVSQLIDLLIDLETNTRAAAESQSDQVKLLKMLVRQSQGVQRMPAKQSDMPEF